MYVSLIFSYIYIYILNIFMMKLTLAQYKRGLTVDNWLESLGLSKYAQQFLINGYFSMDVVKTLQDVDLQCMDIESDDERKLILAAVQDLISMDLPSINSFTPSIPSPKVEEKEEEEICKIAFGPVEVNPEAFNRVLREHNIASSGMNFYIVEQFLFLFFFYTNND